MPAGALRSAGRPSPASAAKLLVIREPAQSEFSPLRLPVRAITLVPFQPIDPAALEQIMTALRSRGVRVQLHSPILRPRGSYDARRHQLKADVLLERVAEVAERPALGITDADCYAGGLNFVFGIADLHGGTAVVSLARLRTGASVGTFTARAMKEIFHELGHAMGLAHCAHRRCVMRFSNSLADTDAKGEELCVPCSRRIAG
jgi:archaemetzincin